MKRILFTGMSGTGKSAVIRELVARGYNAVDTDDGWCEPRADGRQMWREDAIQALLSTEDAEVLSSPAARRIKRSRPMDADEALAREIAAHAAERAVNAGHAAGPRVSWPAAHRLKLVRAIQITETGGPEVLRLAELPDPEPGPGQLLVEVAAAGVNYVDTYHRSGLQPIPLPFVPGREGAGTVTAIGPEVSTVAVGDRVAWATSRASYAERALVPADRAVQVPDGMDIQTLAGCLSQGMTAHYLTVSVHPVQPGETVLVHAAAGGMGLLLTQLATALGSRVIGTVSTAEKERLARAAGAVEVIRYTEVDDLAGEVRRLTDGQGVAAVYDGVGAATVDASLASLRPRGMLALYGMASGPVPPMDTQRLNAAGSVFLTRPKLQDYVATREELTWRAGEVLDAVRQGSLRITISGQYPLADAARAHQDLQGRRTTGKLLLLPGQ